MEFLGINNKVKEYFIKCWDFQKNIYTLVSGIDAGTSDADKYTISLHLPRDGKYRQETFESFIQNDESMRLSGRRERNEVKEDRRGMGAGAKAGHWRHWRSYCPS